MLVFRVSKALANSASPAPYPKTAVPVDRGSITPITSPFSTRRRTIRVHAPLAALCTSTLAVPTKKVWSLATVSVYTTACPTFRRSPTTITGAPFAVHSRLAQHKVACRYLISSLTPLLRLLVPSFLALKHREPIHTHLPTTRNRFLGENPCQLYVGILVLQKLVQEG